MKFFFKCFLLYFFSLVLMPCNDLEACSETAVEAACAVSKEQQHDESSHADDCPPLCSCTCCNHCLVKTMEIFSVKNNTLSSPLSFRYNSTLADMFYPIWQPPKLV